MTDFIRTIGFMGGEARAEKRSQAFKKPSPSWWKMYAAAFERLAELPTDADRFHVVALWHLATQTMNKIPNDPEWVRREAGLSTAPDLERLASFGLIGPVGSVTRAHHARARGENERTMFSESLSTRERAREIRGGEIGEAEREIAKAILNKGQQRPDLRLVRQRELEGLTEGLDMDLHGEDLREFFRTYAERTGQDGS